jgi:hypothetical protein
MFEEEATDGGLKDDVHDELKHLRKEIHLPRM